MVNFFDEDRPKEVSEAMHRACERLASDMKLDIEQGSIDKVLNAIDWNRMMNFKDLDTFHKNYGGWELNEHQVAEVVGAAIAMVYSDAFLDDD